MRTKTLYLFLLLALAMPAFAQKKHPDKDREAQRKEMMEMKLNFLAEEINLADDQRKQFDETYSQMNKERRVYFRKIKEAEKSIADNKNATEADYEKASAEIEKARNEMLLIEKKYDEKFATFLSKKQIYMLKEAETKFYEKMSNCRNKKIGNKR